MIFITHSFLKRNSICPPRTKKSCIEIVSRIKKKKSKLQDAVEHKISTYTGNNLRRVSMRVFVCREATEVSKLGSKSSKVEKCHRRSKDKLLKWKRWKLCMKFDTFQQKVLAFLPRLHKIESIEIRFGTKYYKT